MHSNSNESVGFSSSGGFSKFSSDSSEDDSRFGLDKLANGFATKVLKVRKVV